MSLQNIILVLLATAFCFFVGLFYCLSQPPVYVAKVQVFVKNSDGSALSGNERNRMLALLLSPLVYRETVASLDNQGTPTTLQDFYSAVFVQENKDAILISLADSNATYAQVILERLLNTFRKHVNSTFFDHQIKTISDSRKKRNAALNSVLNDFGQSLQGESQKQGKSNLYAALIAAMGNRIAYDASLAVLKNINDTHQSPLNLEFIANDTAVLELSTQLNKLVAEIAHMQMQLGQDHPQIAAMVAEKNALTGELDKKVILAVNRLYTEADIARNTEMGLREEWNRIDAASQKNLDQSLNELEQKLQKIWHEYDQAIENMASLKDNKLIMSNGSITVCKQSITSRSVLMLMSLTLLAFLLFSIIALILRKIPCQSSEDTANEDNSVPNVDDGAAKTPERLDREPEFSGISFEQLLTSLEKNNAHFVPVVGLNAGQASARLAMGLKHENKTVLLIDISTNEIGNLIGPHRGFTDVLTGDAKISEVIYSDYDTGIDILPQGMASPVRAKDFVSDIPVISASLKHKYSVILLAIAVEPEFGMEEIFDDSDCVVISPENRQEAQKWRDLYSKYSDKSVFILDRN